MGDNLYLAQLSKMLCTCVDGFLTSKCDMFTERLMGKLTGWPSWLFHGKGT
jgi:hypothetical protein